MDLDSDPPTVTLTGPSPAAVDAALAQCLSVLRPLTRTVTCPGRRASRLLAHHGELLRRIQAHSGVTVSLGAGSADADVEVLLEAPDEAALAAARAAVEQIVFPQTLVPPRAARWLSARRPAGVAVCVAEQEIVCPHEAIGAFMGDHGEHLKQLRRLFGEAV